MKTIFATAAIAVAIAWPAFAQDQASEPAPGQAFAQSREGMTRSPLNAFAQQGAVRNARPRLGNPALRVYNSAGEDVGTDPDPFIRNDLARDPPTYND
jgi:hypothetical protein